MLEKRFIGVLLLLFREVRVYLHRDLQVCMAHEILGGFHVHACIIEQKVWRRLYISVWMPSLLQNAVQLRLYAL